MTAQDMRYGRRGGRWAPKGLDRSTPGLCHTCCRGNARYTATSEADPDDSWPMCVTCAAQAKRLRAAVTVVPL